MASELSGGEGVILSEMYFFKKGGSPPVKGRGEPSKMWVLNP